jgi:hypothetical protein
MWHRETSTYAHEMLWRASQSALRTSTIDHPDIRPSHLAVQALLCGFLAFDGFVNLVGEAIAPDMWKDERNNFNSGQFRGIAGKVEYLYSVFPGTTLEKGKEPYQTFKQLKEVRDALAHNRPHQYKETGSDKYPQFETRFDDFNTPQKVEPKIQQLKLLVESIRIEALKLLEGECQSHLRFHAFEGPLLTSIGQEKIHNIHPTQTAITPKK